MGTMFGQGSVHFTNSISSHLTPDASNIVMKSLDSKKKSAYWHVSCRYRTFCKDNGLLRSFQFQLFYSLIFNKPFSVRYRGSTDYLLLLHISSGVV